VLSTITTLGRVKFFFTILIIVFCSAIALSPCARANDTFPGQTISGNNGSFVDNNLGMTGETNEPLSLGGGSLNTQWYTWVAPASGAVSFGTCNPTGSNLTNFDTTIGIYTGSSVGALTQIGFNDDTTGCNSTVNANYGSTVAFNAVAGTAYRIQVDGYASTTGQFNLFYGLTGFSTTVTTAGATEGGATGAFTVVLSAVPTGTATITIGTSTQCSFAPSAVSFTSANWNTPQTVVVTATNDVVVEGSHFCAPASLTPSGGGVATSAAPPPTFTVTDNDTATATIVNTSNGAEAGAVPGVMTVTLSKVIAVNTTLNYSVTGTATSAVDYASFGGSITIAAGSTTGTISIPVIDDAIVETAETVIVTLNSVSSGISTTIGAPNSATNTIADNDAATVTIASTTNGNEAGPVSGVVTVTQSAASATNTVVAYAVSGTATSGSDYTALSGTVTIAAGATSATITIPVINDVAVEGNETVIITLSSVTSGLATLGPTLSATTTILDNDAPTVSIANTTGANEAGVVNGVMTVTRSALSAGAAVIVYSVSGSAASGVDYTSLPGTITIPAGATSATIVIPVIDDVIVESAETVVVTLTSVTSGAVVLGSPLTATNTIADNDVASFTIANAVNATNIAAPTTLNYTITIANTGNVPLTSPTISSALAAGSALTLTSGPTLTSGDAAPLNVLNAGETWIYTATYAVSQNNIDVGSTITHAATFGTTEAVAQTSPTVSTTITQNPQLSIVKTPSTAGPVAAGATVTYTFTVTNSGNMTMHNVAVSDTHNGTGTFAGPTNEVLTDNAPAGGSTDSAVNGIWDSLAPNDVVVFTATYVVTQHDVDYLQ
jgi:Calx-beta domain/Domain of unknown function DUF11